jgi:hypothetical protein
MTLEDRPSPEPLADIWPMRGTPQAILDSAMLILVPQEPEEGESDPRIKPMPEPYDSEPPIMWPSEGSGFEADSYSPAGTAQREWVLSQRLGRSRFGKLVVWLILALVILVPVVSLLIAAFHKH